MKLNRTFILRDETSAQSLWTFLKLNWRQLANSGKPLSVTVQEFKQKRNHDQNKLYWSRLGEIAENAWIGGKQFDEEVWHEFYKGKFIGMIETPDGRMVGMSTTSLSVSEFAEYVTKIEAHATSELGIELIYWNRGM